MHRYLQAFLELLGDVWDLSGEPGHRGSEKEEAMGRAYDYVWAQRERYKERLRTLLQREKIRVLELTPGVDQEALKLVKDELALKEKLLSADLMGIERNSYNREILEFWWKEKEDWIRYYDAKAKLIELGRESNPENESEMKRIQLEIQELDDWMTKTHFSNGQK